MRLFDHPLAKTLRERLWSKVDVRDPDGCWTWTGGTSNGYGSILCEGRVIQAHRASYILHVGPIPYGLYICHKCDNKLCIRPDHLFLGTQQVNICDAILKGIQIGEPPSISEKKTKIIGLMSGWGFSQRGLASILGVNRSVIRNALRRFAKVKDNA